MNQFNVPVRGEVSDNNQAIFDNLNKAIGMVPNLYATMAYSETALANYLQFQNGKTSFSNKEKEVVNLVVSQVNNCSYCLAAHTAIGKMNGFTDEQILQIRTASSDWDQKIDALAKLAKAITVSKGTDVSEELEVFFEQGYSKANLVDLILLIADKVVMNYLHNVTNVPVDFPLAPELEPELN
ncbi:MAG: alkylhydroperoxidase [Flavobacteriaceae bacterium]|nr:alkylhydroperoxidase [Flavobacteriaceae bacterium]